MLLVVQSLSPQSLPRLDETKLASVRFLMHMRRREEGAENLPLLAQVLGLKLLDYR